MPKTDKPISYKKCQRCRKDKQKCLPEVRDWPSQRCNRCARYDYQCSANTKKTQDDLVSVHLSSELVTNEVLHDTRERDLQILLSKYTLYKFIETRIVQATSKSDEPWFLHEIDEKFDPDLSELVFPLREIAIDSLSTGNTKQAHLIIAQIGFRAEPEAVPTLTYSESELPVAWGGSHELLLTWARALKNRDCDLQQLVDCISALETHLVTLQTGSKDNIARLCVAHYDKLETQFQQYLPTDLAPVSLLAGSSSIGHVLVKEHLRSYCRRASSKAQVLCLGLAIEIKNIDFIRYHCTARLASQSNEIDFSWLMSKIAGYANPVIIRLLKDTGYPLRQKINASNNTILHNFILQRYLFKVTARESTHDTLQELVKQEYQMDLKAVNRDDMTALDLAYKYAPKAIQNVLKGAMREWPLARTLTRDEAHRDTSAAGSVSPNYSSDTSTED